MIIKDRVALGTVAGMAASVPQLIFMYGFLFGFEAPKIGPWDLGTNGALFIENLLCGLAAGYLAVRWGPPLQNNEKR